MRTRDQQKESAIRRAAIDMIVHEGFDGMSMQKLARRAGVSPGTLYLYFENREHMLQQLYIEVRARAADAVMNGFDPAMPFGRGMELLWTNRFAYFTKHPSDFRFIERFHNSPLTDGAASETDSRLRHTMTRFFSLARQNGELVDIPFETCWSVLVAPLHQLIDFHLRGSARITRQKLLQALGLVLKAVRP